MSSVQTDDCSEALSNEETKQELSVREKFFNVFKGQATFKKI